MTTTMTMPRAKTTRRTRPVTWETALERYEVHLQARNTPALTASTYQVSIRLFLEHLSRRRERPLPEDVTTSDLRDYQAGLLSGATAKSGRPLAAVTVLRHTAALASLFGFLENEGLLPDDPTRRLERPRRPVRVPKKALGIKEVTRLLEAPDRTTPGGLRDRAILELLFATGVKRGELLALDLVDLDHRERDVVTIRCGRGRKARILPLSRPAHEQVLAYLERGRHLLEKGNGSQALFLNPTGERLREGGLRKLLEKHARTVGLERLTPSLLRRSLGAGLMESGASLRDVQAFLGHRTPNSTAVYLGLDAKDLKHAVLAKHPRERMDV
jgi:integrase/recombinase XerD